MAERRYDFFMLAAEVAYERDGVIKQRRLNAVIEQPKALVTYVAINDTRQAVLSRVCEENAVAPEAIKDFVILSISHLGRGTRAEFQGITPDKKAAQTAH